jgi:hypothetical protein
MTTSIYLDILVTDSVWVCAIGGLGNPPYATGVSNVGQVSILAGLGLYAHRMNSVSGISNTLKRVHNVFQHVSFLGTFLAPNAHIDVHEGAVVTGALHGAKAQIKKDSIIHGDPAIELFIDLFLH